MANIVVISPLLPATGNTSTVNRLRDHFIKSDVIATFLCSDNLVKKQLPCSVNELNVLVTQKQAKGVILIHAVKSGFCVVCSCEQKCRVCVPYGIILGGTDINEDVKDRVKFTLMNECVKNALFYVAFNEAMRIKAYDHFPNAHGYVQPQALDYSLYDACKLNSDTVIDPVPTSRSNKSARIIFVLPCSIRPVKDPLFLVDDFVKLEKAFSKSVDIRLLIIGCVTDSNYGLQFFDKLCMGANQNKVLDKNVFLTAPHSLPSLYGSLNDVDNLKSWISDPHGSKIQFFPALVQKTYLSLLQHGTFFALLNTSKSEGMASSLLEAMALGVPVIARDIVGNKAIVKDHENGLLFSSAEEFIAKATKLLNNPALVNKVVSQAKSYVHRQHNPYNEANFYMSLIQQYFSLPSSSLKEQNISKASL